MEFDNHPQGFGSDAGHLSFGSLFLELMGAWPSLPGVDSFMFMLLDFEALHWKSREGFSWRLLSESEDSLQF